MAISPPIVPLARLAKGRLEVSLKGRRGALGKCCGVDGRAVATLLLNSGNDRVETAQRIASNIHLSSRVYPGAGYARRCRFFPQEK
jgi:hypothetical protein